MINKDKEVGGTHYSDMKVEPIELIEAFNLNFVQGCIVKYVSRYKMKGGIEDLKKALHYCEDYGCKKFDRFSDRVDWTHKTDLIVKMYCMLNNLDDLENQIIMYALKNDFEKCHAELENLIKRQETKK